MKQHEEWILMIGLLLCIVAVFALANQRDNIKKQAVERGFATFVPDSSGNTTFVWKENTNEVR
jgi:hypothetical protein